MTSDASMDLLAVYELPDAGFGGLRRGRFSAFVREITWYESSMAFTVDSQMVSWEAVGAE
jgi:hypothetical protein